MVLLIACKTYKYVGVNTFILFVKHYNDTDLKRWSSKFNLYKKYKLIYIHE